MNISRTRPPTSKLAVPFPLLFLVSLSLMMWLVVGIRIHVSPAQVVLDGTTGGVAGQALGAGTLPNGQTLSDGSTVTDHLIPHDVGTLIDQNLFHSFQNFSIASGKSATFTGPNTINNVLSRVTGENASNIQGILASTIEDANVFLFNPHGVVFGPNATLDLRGSFHVSTADAMGFKKNGHVLNFYADVSLDGTSGSVLHVPSLEAFGFVWDPTTVGFTKETPASIAINHSQLQVPEGYTLSIIGGDVTITGAGSLAAPKGAINLVSVRSPGALSLAGGVLELSSFQSLGEVGITDSAVHGQRIVIRGERFKVENSTLRAEALERRTIDIQVRDEVVIGNQASLNATGPQGGRIHVKSETGTNWVSGTVEALGLSGQGGTVHLLGEQVGLDDGGRVDVSGETGGGRVLVGGDFQGTNPLMKNASRTYVGPEAAIFADARTTGDGGTLVIWSDEVTQFFGGIRARGGIQSGDGGFAEVSGKQELVFRGMTDLGAVRGQIGTLLLDPSDIIIQNSADASGVTDALENNNVALQADNTVQILTGIEIKDDANTNNLSLRAGTGIGDGEVVIRAPVALTGGDIEVTAGDKITISGNDNGLFTNTTGSKEAGRIIVQGRTVTVADGATVTSSSQASAMGSTGRVVVQGMNGEGSEATLVTLDNATITTNTESSKIGGDIMIKAATLALKGEAVISSGTTGDGAAGSIAVTAGAVTLTEEAEIRSDTAGSGKGGDVTLTANTVTLRGDAEISSDVEENAGGTGGMVTIKAGTITLMDNPEISTDTTMGSSGDGGQVELFATEAIRFLIPMVPGNDDSIGSEEAGVFTNSEGTGNAGTIVVTTPLMEMNGGVITARTSGPGIGGNVTIDAARVQMTNGAAISAESISQNPDAGGGGAIEVKTTESIELTGSKISATVSGGTLAGGNITLKGGELVLLQDGTTVSATNTGAGVGGDVLIRGVDSSSAIKQENGETIHLVNTIRLVENSTVSTNSNSATGGDITLSADFLIDLIDSKIESNIGTVTGSEDRGGNIDLDPQFIVLQGNTMIAARSEGGGAGGTVSLGRADTFIITDSAREGGDFVDVSSVGGQAGEVIIRGV
jgi:filamentous hemagglutinin family protein